MPVCEEVIGKKGLLMRLISLLGIVMLVTLSLACDQSAQVVPETIPLGEIGFGVVVDRDGRPVADAEVFGLWKYPSDIGPPVLAKARTDQFGMFSLKPPPGIRTPSFAVVIRDHQGNIGTGGQYARDGLVPMLRIELVPETFFHVHVVDQQGQACPGVEVACDSLLAYASEAVATTDVSGFAKVLYIKMHINHDRLVARLPRKGLSCERIVQPPVSGETPPKVVMTLTPVQPYQVEVVDSSGRPVPNAMVAVKRMQLSGLYESTIDGYYEETDAKGLATVDLSGGRGYLKFAKIGFCDRPASVKPSDFLSKTSGQPIPKRVVLPEQTTIETTILNESGVALTDYQVEVRGSCRWFPKIEQSRRLDDANSCSIRLPVESRIAIWATSGSYRTEAIPLSIPHGSNPQAIQLVFQSPTKVRGTLLAVSNGQPIARRRIAVTGNVLPRDQIDDAWLTPKVWNLDPPEYEQLTCDDVEAMTDDEGKFELALAPGEYHLQEASRGESVTIKVDSAKPLDLTVWGAKLPCGQVTGQIALADGVRADIGELTILCRPHNTMSQLPAPQLSQDGTFTLPIAPVAQTVLAWNKRGDLAGSATILPHSQTAVVSLKRTVFVEGRMYDPETLRPDSSLRPHIQLMVDVGRGKWMKLKEELVLPSGTDFHITGLIPGAQYWLSPRQFTVADFNTTTSPDVIAFTAPDVGMLNIGPLFGTPQHGQDISKLDTQLAFHPPIPLVTRFGIAANAAGRLDQKLLVILADLNDRLTQELLRQTRQFDHEHADLQQAIQPYQLIWIDKETLSEEDLQRYPLPNNGDSKLLVMDAAGNTLDEIPFGKLQEDNQWNWDRLLSFLKRHGSETLDALEIYEAAIQQARLDNKLVLVTYGHYGQHDFVDLELNLEASARTLSQFCVVCSLKSRMPQAPLIAERLWANASDTSYPWMILVAPENGKDQYALHSEPIIFSPSERASSMRKLIESAKQLRRTMQFARP